MPNSHQTRRVLLNQVEKNWKMKSRHGKLEHWFFTQVSNEIQHVFVIYSKFAINLSQ